MVINSGGSANLLPQHAADLADSGLTAETIAAAGFYSDEDAASVAKMLGWAKPAPNLGPWLAIPYRNHDGTLDGYTRFKPDRPRVKDGKVVKYESKKGTASRAYYPPGSCGSVLD